MFARGIASFALLLAALFGALLLVIAAPVYENSVVDIFLSPVLSDCAEDFGCMFAVVDGGLRLGDALTVLEAHPWVRSVRISRGMALDTGMVTWEWNGAQPDYIAAHNLGEMWVESGRVAFVEIRTRIPLGAVWLRQVPRQGVLIRTGTTPPHTVQRLDYAALHIYSQTPCPLTPRGYWQTNVSIRISSPASTSRTRQFAPSGGRIPPLWGGCG